MTVKYISEATLPTRFGPFVLHIFGDENGNEHMALTCGNLSDNCLVRLHSECATGDILCSLRCDCRDQLEEALKKISAEGGLFIYIRGHEGRGIGLGNKIKAYKLQDQGMNTVEANLHLGFPADLRNYSVPVEIIRHFRLSRIRLLTNNQEKIEAIERAGIKIEERVPLWATCNSYNAKYIQTKQCAMGHLPSCQD